MKAYRSLISFGDGKPITAVIHAKNGMEAQDIGFASYPGARCVRILGVKEDEEIIYPQKPEPPPTVKPVDVPTALRDDKGILNREELMLKAVQLRTDGLSFTQIANALDVGKTTVRRWLSNLQVH